MKQQKLVNLIIYGTEQENKDLNYSEVFCVCAGSVLLFVSKVTAAHYNCENLNMKTLKLPVLELDETDITISSEGNECDWLNRYYRCVFCVCSSGKETCQLIRICSGAG